MPKEIHVKTEQKDQIQISDSSQVTEFLFNLLEEREINFAFTNIKDLVQIGANLQVKRDSGPFSGCYPIQIAAYQFNIKEKELNEILQSFTDPEKRYEHLKLKNDKELNVLDCIIEKEKDNSNLSKEAQRCIEALFSYLNHEQQEEYLQISINRIEESKRSIPEYLSDIRALIQEKNYIPLCTQREEEEAFIKMGYDSEDDSLGVLGLVDQGEKETTNLGVKKMGTEEIFFLSTIPSDWRIKTSLKNKQGDHVTAYILLLNSFNYCKGENIKTLPKVLYENFCKIMPDKDQLFLELRKEAEYEATKGKEERRDQLRELKKYDLELTKSLKKLEALAILRKC